LYIRHAINHSIALQNGLLSKVEAIRVSQHTRLLRDGRVPCQAFGIEYVAKQLTTEEYVTIQTILLDILQWLINTGWIHASSILYTLYRWYPKYEDMQVPSVLINITENCWMPVCLALMTTIRNLRHCHPY
jgi:hypothetical protein